MSKDGDARDYAPPGSSACSVTTKFSERQLTVLSVIEDHYSIKRTELIRRLVDTNLEPIAVRLGVPGEKPVDATHVRAIEIPSGMSRMTKSQIAAMIDMFLCGWTMADLADFYQIDRKALNDLFGGRTKAQIRTVEKNLRRAIKRERDK